LATHLCVASYNIHRCVGSDWRRDVRRVADVIRELQCDAVGLQEVESKTGSGEDAMQLEFLARATGMTAVAGLTIVRREADFGNALLTRHPILEVRRHELAFLRREPRSALDVDLDVHGQSVRVIVTHLGLRPAERRYQVQQMLCLLRRDPIERTTVVLGDINEWLPTSRPLRWLHEVFGKPPAQRSFPGWMPVLALDRVWVRPRKALLSLRAHRSPLSRRASDHLPVKAIVDVEAHAHAAHEARLAST
jgi:endonuclease/exonuclease/phosphatase family metal-dependent hydrolase